MNLKFLSFFVILLCFPVWGQVNSSYTRFGIGDIQYTYSARRLGMGGVNISIADIDFININNPATLYRLNLTRFEVALKYGGEQLSNDNMKKFYANTDFNGFTFGFPISSLYGIGAAIGIVPVSSVSYHVEDNLLFNTNSEDSYSYSFSGTGGISKIFIGSSYRTPLNVNIGASFDYYFGNLHYNSSVNFPNNSSYNAYYSRTYNPNGIGTTIGLLSPDLADVINAKNITDFRIGAAINYVANLNTDTILIASSSSKIDTLVQSTVKMKIPLRISSGISFILDNNYLFSVDYIYQPWSKFTFNGIKSNYLRNASKLSAGFEYRPSKEPGSSFWEQFLFRAGLSYEQTQYIINGEGINQYSISGGFSLPLSYENSVDVGLEYAIRGTKKDGLYKENIYRLNVSLTLGDLWFVRRER
jgi:hypothetical protein